MNYIIIIFKINNSINCIHLIENILLTDVVCHIKISASSTFIDRNTE